MRFTVQLKLMHSGPLNRQEQATARFRTKLDAKNLNSHTLQLASLVILRFEHSNKSSAAPQCHKRQTWVRCAALFSENSCPCYINALGRHNNHDELSLCARNFFPWPRGQERKKSSSRVTSKVQWACYAPCVLGKLTFQFCIYFLFFALLGGGSFGSVQLRARVFRLWLGILNNQRPKALGESRLDWLWITYIWPLSLFPF